MNRRTKSGRDKKYLRSKRNSHMRRKTLKRRKINKTLRKRTLKRKNTKRSNRGGGFGYQCGKTWRKLGEQAKGRLTTIHAVKNKTRKGLLDYTTYDIVLSGHRPTYGKRKSYKISDLKFKDIKELKNKLENDISALKYLQLDEMEFKMHMEGKGKEQCIRRFQQINAVFVPIGAHLTTNHPPGEDWTKKGNKVSDALAEIGKSMEVYEPASTPAPKTTPKPGSTSAMQLVASNVKKAERAADKSAILATQAGDFAAAAAANRKAEQKKRANQWYRKTWGLKHLANLVDPISPETTLSPSI